jgi:hypothetical protein
MKMLKLEDKLNTIKMSTVLFNIAIGSLKRNMNAYMHIPKDKREIVMDKLSKISSLLDVLEGGVKENTDWIFRKQDSWSKRASSLKSDISLINTTISKCDMVENMFLEIEKGIQKTEYVRYNDRLKKLFLDFLKIKSEFKTILKWYERLIELGF